LLPPSGRAGACVVSLDVAVVQLLEVQDQLLRVLAAQRRHGYHALGDAAPQGLQVPGGLGQVHLVGHDHLRPPGQAGLELVQLVVEVVQVGPGLGLGHVQDKQQAAASLDVAQEGDAQAAVQVGAADDARDVGHWTGGGGESTRSFTFKTQ